MSNLQPNCCLEFDFRKVDQHAGGKWLIHDTKRRKDNQLQSVKLPCRISKLSSKMWHKGVRWHRVESNILKYLVSKYCFKQIHNVRSILVLGCYQRARQLVNQRKHKMAFRSGTAHSPIERDGVQLCQYWMTLPLYIRPITELVWGMYTHIYIHIY